MIRRLMIWVAIAIAHPATAADATTAVRNVLLESVAAFERGDLVIAADYQGRKIDGSGVGTAVLENIKPSVRCSMAWATFNGKYWVTEVKPHSKK